MNSIYRSVWNRTTSTFVATSENARSHASGSPSRASTSSSELRFGLRAVALGLMLAFGAHAWALPAGGAVSAGSASIANAPGTTTVSQTTQNAAINWQSFSIGQGEAVSFVQPSASSVTLNRVLGSDPSSILGSLSANGKVFLVNPNGILFGQGAQVNVGALVASTLNINDTDFMAGKYNFTGTGTGNVLNQGTINADGGYVALLGANVSNQGVITARLGSVVLAAGSAMTLDVAGDGLLNVTVNQGAVNALVENGGMIHADGGNVLLTALAAGNLLQSAVNNTGVIQAQTIGSRNGTIRLMGDMQTGTANVAGTLDASAPNGGNGGFIETSAAHVKVQDGARITTAAPQGQSGTWLIDPVDFVIQAGFDISGAALSANLNAGNVAITTVAGPGAGNGDIFVNEAVTWNGLTGTAGVPTTLTLTALRDTNINAPISPTTSNLVVCCGRDINVNAAITLVSGSVLLSAGRDVNVVRTALNPGTAITVTDGNTELCAVRDINLSNLLNPGGTPLMTQTRSSAIATLSLASLNVPLGLTLNAGIGATGPGPAGGTVNFVNGGVAGTFITVTGPGAPVTIRYNPTSYLTPTNYALDFTGTGGPVVSQMLVFPGGADKIADGTTTAVFAGLQGAPAGVTLVTGGGTANFDTALAGVGKPITYSGFTLAGPNVADFSLPVACCGSTITRVTGTILPAAIVPPPGVIPPPVVVPVAIVAAEEALPEIQNILGSEYPRSVPGLGLGVIEGGVRMPPVLVAASQPVPVMVVPVAPVAPVVAPPPPPPEVYVPPVRRRKADRN